MLTKYALGTAALAAAVGAVPQYGYGSSYGSGRGSSCSATYAHTSYTGPYGSQSSTAGSASASSTAGAGSSSASSRSASSTSGSASRSSGSASASSASSASSSPTYGRSSSSSTAVGGTTASSFLNGQAESALEYSTYPVAGYSNAAVTFDESATVNVAAIPTSFSADSQVPAQATSPGSAYPIRSSQVTGPTSHGPYTGPYTTTTGAVMASTTLAASIAPLPLNPTATYYNTNGMLTHPEPAPFTPYGGLGTNGSLPRYMVESDFDYESITLGLYQEWIELDSFHNGLAVFSVDDFIAAGLTAEDRFMIEFMADQESGHATLLTNMLGVTAPPQCTYNYPFTTVREFVDFNQRITRWGESGVWGFINHLDSREVGQLLAQSIATEARQQMIFRQMSGLFPMPVWFETGIPQSWQWTYLAPYISTCPANTTRLAWQNFPALNVVNQANINRWSPNDTANYESPGNRTSDPSRSTIPEAQSCENVNVTGYGCGPAISRNRSEPLTFPGKQIFLTWDDPGLSVGPNNSYVTSTQAGTPTYVAWVSQLNLTYTPLTLTGSHSGYTFAPASEVYQGDPAANGTMFIAATDNNLFLTPFNLSMINPSVRALGLYMAG